MVGEKTITNKELSNMFKTPRAGVYTIGLQVQDQYGLWSDWTYQEITILPNEAPHITYLGTEKKNMVKEKILLINSLILMRNGKLLLIKNGPIVSKVNLPQKLF